MDIFSKDETIISDIVNRLLNCRNIHELSVFGNCGKELSFLYPAVQVKYVKKIKDLTGDVSFIHITEGSIIRDVMPWIMENKKDRDFILYISEGADLQGLDLAELGMPHHLELFSGMTGILYLLGVSFQQPDRLPVPDDFKVLAIVHFYNEADIIERTIQHLLNQGLDIYLLDNWSDDGSFEAAQRYQNEYPERIYLERFPESGRSGDYEWYSQLEKTEMLAETLDYSWFIHYDMDEMRISPWKNVTLREAVYWIDRQGYNCIENTVIDFRMTERSAGNIFMEDTFFDFRHKKIWIDQLKTWKKSERIELKSSGGHFAQVDDPKIYPLKILNRHYPLRSIEQAEKKVFLDRLPRFQKERKQRGWHGQYDGMHHTGDFIFESSKLLLWEGETFDKLYIPLFLECGLRWNNGQKVTAFQFPAIEGKKVFIYGAGRIGRRVYLEAYGKYDVAGWIDKDFMRMPVVYCEEILPPAAVKDREFDYVIIAVKNGNQQREISMQLQEMGVSKEKICCIETFSAD